ncbi:MAG: ornithine cyclodeaminase family protein [Chloroflexi bacterium]|nr:ornithine cyclodeaminase family protein [Chloroflexota bacterium]
MLLIDKRTVAELLTPTTVVTAVKSAFVAHARGRTVMPPKVYLTLPAYHGDFRAMPAYVDGAAGLKWVNVHPRNPAEHGLPTVMGVVIYNDPSTGQPLAVMDGTLITSWRTAAAAAIATRMLARPDARTLGIIGCGAQAEVLLLVMSQVWPLEEVLLADQKPQRIAALRSLFPGVPTRTASVEEAAGAEIVCTLTPSTAPIVWRNWVRPGAHINAIGADAPGKQELDPQILLDSRVVVDELEQSVHGGELNVAISRGIYHPEQIAGTLGLVLTGAVAGRTTSDQITVFDSTGLAIQDIATARVVYEAARQAKRGLEVEIG